MTNTYIKIKLEQTDFLVMPDYPLTQELLDEVKSYRQALRDCNSVDTIPQEPEWIRLKLL